MKQVDLRPEMNTLFAEAKAKWEAMTPMEQALMTHEQAKSYARSCVTDQALADGAVAKVSDLALVDMLLEQNKTLRRFLKTFLYLVKPSRSDPDPLGGLPDSHAFSLHWSEPHRGDRIILAGQIRRAQELVK